MSKTHFLKTAKSVKYNNEGSSCERVTTINKKLPGSNGVACTQVW